MVSSVLPSLVCVLCVILLPAVWADYCSSFVDTSGYQHHSQQCGSEYCCGNCEEKYCCGDRKYRLSQERCTGSHPGNDKRSRIATLLGSILGSIFPIIICVGLVICCVAPCCLFYKKCRKGRNRGSQNPRNATTTVINVPQQPHPVPSGYQPSYPGYLPVPAQPGYGGMPSPTAPPSYMETTNPAHNPGAYPAGLPMLPIPGQAYAPPPYSNELAPMPYNPSYGPGS